MHDLSGIKAGMKVLGADDARVGIVASVDEDRIRLEAVDIGSHAGHKHYIPGGIVAIVEENTVRLSATGANAVLLDEEIDGSPAD
ncbi:DUF2171 domain-containing protein [Pelagibacterium sp. 26DY04]|uniref:DUF2171 domain-containing protein n=1 Tax=Pelagibacterium sp. 26DY04 TaxID=2967130 RepID=UPI00281641C7|nr:DUF2171 domain-containing protein [Pelagibacterium sp. 26DY04]WMT86484.1 DUF2171 domain-containing protein [Pelagibacterium sp. 26DY04]